MSNIWIAHVHNSNSWPNSDTNPFRYKMTKWVIFKVLHIWKWITVYMTFDHTYIINVSICSVDMAVQSYIPQITSTSMIILVFIIFFNMFTMCFTLTCAYNLIIYKSVHNWILIIWYRMISNNKNQFISLFGDPWELFLSRDISWIRRMNEIFLYKNNDSDHQERIHYALVVDLMTGSSRWLASCG